MNKLNYRVNEEINFPSDKNVRIVGNNIESKVMPFGEAMNVAKEMQLDLIEINTNAEYPILRIERYDKFLYEQKKNLKKKKPQTNTTKEIDIRVNIAPNDLATKVRQAKEFISQGHKVKVVLTIRGRELSRREYSEEAIKKFIQMMEDVAVVELYKSEGNKTLTILRKK